MNGCSKATVEVTDSMVDGSVGMEEVRWKFEEEVFSKYSVRDQVAIRIVD